MKFELTIEEANALVNLLDLAVKRGGIRTATIAVPLLYKLEQAAQNGGANHKEANE